MATERPANINPSWLVVALLSLLYLVAYLDRFVFALLIGLIKVDIPSSDTEFGLLVGPSFAIFYVLFALPMSRVADRWNRRILIVMAGFIWNGMTAASAFAPNLMTLVLLRIGVAFGEAALVPAALSMIGDLFLREHRTRPLAVFTGSGAIGTAGSLVFGAAMIQLASSHWIQDLPWFEGVAPWRLVLLFLGGAGLALTAVFAMFTKEPKRLAVAKEEGASVADVAKQLSGNAKAYAAVAMTSCLLGIVFFAMITWYPAYLVRNFHIGITQAGFAFGLIGLLVTPIAVAIGPAIMGLINRRSRDDGFIWVAIAGTILVPPLLFASIAAHSLLISLAFAVPAYLVMVAFGNLSFLVLSLLPPAWMRGQVTALYSFFAVLFSLGVGPPVVALFSEKLFPGEAGIGIALVAVACSLAPVQVLVLLLTRTGFARSIHAAAEQERSAVRENFA